MLPNIDLFGSNFVVSRDLALGFLTREKLARGFCVLQDTDRVLIKVSAQRKDKLTSEDDDSIKRMSGTKSFLVNAQIERMRENVREFSLH